ncbi:hypothetical protein FO440_02845 [Mucilaginibacter corticis]|uniref:Uncharacterized protein n=1 Tax=Mucilaginibacter corticis TaxID=2597670 RepID=A0A556MTD7_9SPHI|nr:hypothetical protein [Mucilaginibacter corticis]TSJ43145.1 hypothetical protein FO440_02845 [Mucilaginibacter corticis]
MLAQVYRVSAAQMLPVPFCTNHKLILNLFENICFYIPHDLRIRTVVKVYNHENIFCIAGPYNGIDIPTITGADDRIYLFQ